MIRARILSRVDFPAPFRPMMPTTSPAAISNDTSLTAQNHSCPGCDHGAVEGRAHSDMIDSDRRPYGARCVRSGIACRRLLE